MEYAYSKARRNMRSLIQAINMFTNAISAAIAEALITLSRDPLLIWNYAVFAILTFVGGTLFIIQFWGLDKEEDELNNLPGGHVQTEPYLFVICYLLTSLFATIEQSCNTSEICFVQILISSNHNLFLTSLLCQIHPGP
ncbi:hypothetical protein ACN38_g7564 [Penicillium nordicum]|uniref:Uncharacterized protein n=1 Tax=Penicillium nordicum TaxID=229535 RepID=A0A0M8NYP7_9EURO|nr:hypothetical protein ACN38_g7564 [Penicillium nordicum]